METTDFLSLLKKDPVIDAQDTFDIETMLNQNWDKIDAACFSLTGLVQNAARIAAGSYVGTGTHGSENPTSLTFSFQPKFVFISSLPFDNNNSDFPVWAFMVANSKYGVSERTSKQYTSPANYDYRGALALTWNENSVSWYIISPMVGSYEDSQQMNASGIIHYYIAIG